MNKEKSLSTTFVFLQFALIIWIALTGPIIATSVALLTLELLGLFLGSLAIFEIGLGKFNITPNPPDDFKLVKTGIYKMIRHPMYSALLISTLALVLNAPSPLRWGLSTALLVTLLSKLTFEEKLISAQYPEYVRYQSESAKLIPFIF